MRDMTAKGFHESRCLAALADQIRAEAQRGLHLASNDEDRARFTAIRRLTAQLLALVDARSVDTIEAELASSEGPRTPLVAIGLQIHTADHQILGRAWHLPSGQTLDQALQEAAKRIGGSELELNGTGESYHIGALGPHTYLAVYDTTTPLTAGAVDEAWPAAHTSLEQGVDPSNPDGDWATWDYDDSWTDQSCGIEPGDTVPQAAAPHLAAIAALCDAWPTSSAPGTATAFRRISDRARTVPAGAVPAVTLDLGALDIDAAAARAECALFASRDRLLLTRANDDAAWAMPGGTSRVGESWGSTAVRSMQAAAGLDVTDTLMGAEAVVDERVLSSAPAEVPITAVFLAELPRFDQKVDISEGDRARWVSEGDLAGLELAPGQEHKMALAFAGARSRLFLSIEEWGKG